MDIVTLAAAKALAGGGGGGGGSAVLIVTDTDGTLNKTYNEIVTAAESKVVMYKYTYDDGDDVGTVYCRFYMSEVYNNEEFIVYFRDVYASGEPSFTASSADGYPVRDP